MDISSISIDHIVSEFNLYRDSYYLSPPTEIENLQKSLKSTQDHLKMVETYPDNENTKKIKDSIKITIQQIKNRISYLS